MLQRLALLLAPILSFTAEEAWQHVPTDLRGVVESIFDLELTVPEPPNMEELQVWSIVKDLRAAVSANEGARDFELCATIRAGSEYDALSGLR